MFTPVSTLYIKSGIFGQPELFDLMYTWRAEADAIKVMHALRSGGIA